MGQKHNRMLQPELEAIEIAGTFTCTGASNPSNAANEGVGFTVVRTGVGVHRITTKDAFNSVAQMPTYQVHLVGALADRKALGAAAPVQNANKTWSFDVTTVAVAAATEMANGDKISFRMKLFRGPVKH